MTLSRTALGTDRRRGHEPPRTAAEPASTRRPPSTTCGPCAWWRSGLPGAAV